MALLNLNKLFDEIRGKIGNLVIRRRPDGTMIVSSKPRYKGKRYRKGTPAQRAHWDRVKEIAPFASYLARTHPSMLSWHRAKLPEASGCPLITLLSPTA